MRIGPRNGARKHAGEQSRLGRWARFGRYLLVFLILGLVFVNAQLFRARIDLTEDRRYSLSEVTRELLAEPEAPLRIRYYAGETLREFMPLVDDIEDMLAEYRAAGAPRVNVEVLNTDDPEVADEAERHGLISRTLAIAENGGEQRREVYSGIVVDYLDERAVIPVVVDATVLEYELTARISDVLHGRKQIGVLPGTDGESLDADYRLLVDFLSERFELFELERGEAPPPATDAVLLLGGHDLTVEELATLQSYVEDGGGGLLTLAGAVRVNPAELRAVPAGGAPIFDLLERYGVRVLPALVLDEYHLSFPAPAEGGMTETPDGMRGSDGPPYPHWISMDERFAAPDHPITARLTVLDLMWASPLQLGPVRAGPDIGGEAEPLVVTSPESWLQREPFVLAPEQAPQFERDRAETEESRVVAAVTNLETPAEGREGGRVVVVGDSDFASNLIHYTGRAANLLFIESAIAWLAEDKGIAAAGVRGRGPGRLDRIEYVPARITTLRVVEFVTIVLVPLTVLLYGAVHVRRRRRRPAGSGGD